MLMWLGRIGGVSAGPLEGQGEDEPSCRYAKHQKQLRQRQNQSPRPATNRFSERKRDRSFGISRDYGVCQGVLE